MLKPEQIGETRVQETMNKTKEREEKLQEQNTQLQFQLAEQHRALEETRDGNLWVVVIVKSWVNKPAGSWLVTQEWTTNQKPG